MPNNLLALWGSSSMASNYSDVGPSAPYSIADNLRPYFPNMLTEGALGAFSSRHSALVRGALMPRVTFPSGRIPAQEVRVGVDPAAEIWAHGWLRVHGTINGVPGTLRGDGSAFWFASDVGARGVDGNFVSDYRTSLPGDTRHIFWIGKNNIRASAMVMSDLAEMWRLSPSGWDNSMVLGQWATPGEPPGSLSRRYVENLNDWQRIKYGNRFLDIQTLLTTSWGLSCPNVASWNILGDRNAADQARRGIVPDVLMASTDPGRMHLNALGYRIVTWAIVEKMNELGWL